MEKVLLYVMFRFVIFVGIFIWFVHVLVHKKKILDWKKSNVSVQAFVKRNEVLINRFLKGIITLFLVFMLAYQVIPFTLDVPSIIRKEYRLSSGFVKNWDYSHEDRVKARPIMFIDEVDKEEKSITVLAEGIYEGEYIKVQYLPHLRLGIVLERGKDD